jgi:hypothetical protein
MKESEGYNCEMVSRYLGEVRASQFITNKNRLSQFFIHSFPQRTLDWVFKCHDIACFAEFGSNSKGGGGVQRNDVPIQPPQ